MSGMFNTLFGAGGSAKTDRSNTLQGFTDTKNLFNFALPQAEKGAATGAGTTATGTNMLGQAGDYFKTLMSGNRAATQQAIAPVANQQASQADAQRRQLAASGTARGGGTAAVEQDAKSKQMATIDNLLFGAQTEGAKETADVGGKLAQVGLGESANANAALGVGAEAANSLTANSVKARQVDAGINQDIVGNATNALESVFAAFA